MTADEKIDLLLEKITGIEQGIKGLEQDMKATKRQLMKSTAELKAMDELIFDEVERVHAILDRHKEDKTVHTA